MIKPSSTQAATSRIKPATAVRPKDLEELGGELFMPISLPVGAAEQEDLPLPGRTPEEDRPREAGLVIATADRYELPSLASSHAILAVATSGSPGIARRLPAPRPTRVSW